MPGGKISSNVPAQKATRSRMKEMSRREMGTDFGLLPPTFIQPRAKDLPSWFGKEYKLRLKIAWLRLKLSVQSFVSLVYTLKWDLKRDPLTNKKPKNPMSLSSRTKVARELHQKLYTAIAEGDSATIQRIACTGLAHKLKIRLDHRRGANLPAQKWQLVQYKGITYPTWLRWPLLSILPSASTRIVSDKMAAMPMGRDSSLRQFIAKISSVQSLDKGDGKGPVTSEVEEYIVFQRLKIEGNERDWMIWGTLDPSTKQEAINMAEGVDQPEDTDRVGFADRVRNAASSYMTM